MSFLNTEKVPLGECCAISETCEMFTFLMALTMPNETELSHRSGSEAALQLKLH